MKHLFKKKKKKKERKKWPAGISVVNVAPRTNSITSLVAP